MRARITLAFVAVLAVALFIAGAVSLLLVRHAASNTEKQTLLVQARELVKNPKTVQVPGVLPLLTDVGGISADGIFTVDRFGRVLGTLPPGIPTSALGGLSLAHGHDVSGSHDHLAFAAVPLFSAAGTTVVLWLESIERFSDDSIWYFLVAGSISLAVAGVLATVITARIARRVNVAAQAAKEIASGDFSTRIALEKREYPELVDLNSSINAMAEDLERAQDAERQFLMSISHDLRTPLTSIRGYSEAIVEGAVPDQERAARVVVDEADRLERLIDDLLDLARLRAKRFSFNYSSFSLAPVVQSATEALPLALNGDTVHIDYELPGRDIEMISDPHRIGQIASNLVENALKFAHSAVTVTIASPDVSTARITVQDDGPGIAADDLPHIFERLYTTRLRPTRSTGTGIGLAIVAELAEAMGGSVEVHSPLSDDGGSRFVVTLPAAQHPNDQHPNDQFPSP